MSRFRLPLLLGMALSLGGTALSAQAGCGSNAKAYLAQAANQEMQNDKSGDIRDFIAQSNAPGTIGSGGMSQCAGESFPIQLPGVASILSGVAKQAIQQACNQARSAVSQQIPSYLKGMYNVVSTNGMNTTINQVGTQAVNATGATGVVNSTANTAINNLFGGGH